MRLLGEAGVPVAPHVVVPVGDDSGLGLERLGARLVVKLADVPHRTEIDGVVLDVAPPDVGVTTEKLRAVARAHGVPDVVVAQPMVAGRTEAFAGLHCRTDLGPVVLLGAGGVQVEEARQVSGRMLPISEAGASALADEIVSTPAFAGQRRAGTAASAPLAAVVLALAELWHRHGAWLHSVDVNPLIVSDDGAVAVDALLIARTKGATP